MHLTHTRVNGRYTLRLAVGAPLTGPEHVDRAWDLLSAAATDILAGVTSSRRVRPGQHTPRVTVTAPPRVDRGPRRSSRRAMPAAYPVAGQRSTTASRSSAPAGSLPVGAVPVGGAVGAVPVGAGPATA